MKNLMSKELRLVSHPTMFIFMSFGLMLLIPSYPYYVAFFYGCLGLFFTFMNGRENRDVFYTVILPIRKRDAVKARCLLVTLVELVMIIISIPFAIIGVNINPNPAGNTAGIESNVAFYGFVLIMFAIFNAIFIIKFYKTAYKVGMAFLTALIPTGLFIVIMEIIIHFPILNTYLDTTDPKIMITQIPILIFGIAIYVIGMIFTYKKSADNFEKVDL